MDANRLIKIKLSLSQIFFGFCLFFLIGVAVSGVIPINQNALSYSILIVACSVIVAASFKASRLITYFLLLAALLLGLWRGYLTSNKLDYVGLLVNQTVDISGEIVSIPQIKTNYQSFNVQINKILNTDLQSSEKIYVLARTDNQFSLHDYVSLSCLIQKSDAGNIICAFPELLNHIPQHSNSWQNILPKAYNYFVNTLNKVYVQPEAGFIIGILVGGTQQFSNQLIEEFRITGTLHLVALSGFNVSIIVGFLTIVYERLAVPRRWYAPSIGILLVLFVFFVGPAASIIRASIMGFLVALARQRGRYTSPHNLLIATAAIMVFVSPAILLSDIGFQLSFLATVGIIYFSPLLESWLTKIPEVWQFKEALLLSISAQVMVLPLLIYNFEHLSTVSPFVNMLIAPLIPVTMMFGFIGGVLGLINISLGQVFGLLAYLCSAVVLKIISWFATLPLAYIEWSPNIFILLLYYVVVFFVLQKSKTKAVTEFVPLR